jgi:hypothetical protein
VLLELVAWAEDHTSAPSQAEFVRAIRANRDAVVKDVESRVRESIARLS